MEEDTNNEQHLDLDDERLHDVTGGAWFGGQRAHAENMISMLQKNARVYARMGHDQGLADHLEGINSITDKIKGF